VTVVAGLDGRVSWRENGSVGRTLLIVRKAGGHRRVRPPAPVLGQSEAEAGIKGDC
jgi:hypothetical protein